MFYCTTQVSNRDGLNGMTRIQGTKTSSAGSFQTGVTTRTLKSNSAAARTVTRPTPSSSPPTPPSSCWSPTLTCASTSREWKWGASTSTGTAKTFSPVTRLVVTDLTRMSARISKSITAITINKKRTLTGIHWAEMCHDFEGCLGQVYWFL